MIPAPRLTGPRKLRVLQGSPEWLEARRTHITATDLPVLLGISPWRSEQDLADEKLNGNGQESTLKMRVGSALEDLIAAAYAEQTGRKVRRVRGLWESRHVPWAAASPDASAAGRLVELKWTGSRSRFAGGLPEDVEAQVAWQLFVAEAAEADVATLTVGDDEVRIFTVRADEGLQRHLVAIASDFRRRLAEGGPFAQSLDSLKRKYPRDNGAEMVADSDMDQIVRNLLAIRAHRRDLEADEKDFETRIKSRMGELAAVRGRGYHITWKRTKDRVEVNYRDLAESLLTPMPEPERDALVGSFTTVQEGFRPFRVVAEKEEEA